MSLQTFLSTVEADITGAFKVIETDAETALTDIWALAKPVFTAAEPTIVKDVLTAIQAFLSTAAADVTGNDFAGIEQAFLEDLEAAGNALFSTAQGLGSSLLQILIALAKNAVAAP